MSGSASDLPVIDVAPLVAQDGELARVAEEIGNACRNAGFFYIVGHGIDVGLQQRLENLSRQFFALDVDRKLDISMRRGGRAWRGYFRVGDELTSGLPDRKEGLYFGAELSDDHPKVAAGVPMHGSNLFPAIPGFEQAVLSFMDALTQLGHALMRGIALSLGLGADHFRKQLTTDPLILFRIFHYPSQPVSQSAETEWGVGEHTDYGLLTILRQDDCGGLQVRRRQEWIDAKPIPNSFVCNIGDMLDRMTGGLYRSTPHRVLNSSGQGRLSFPFFFDPGFDAAIRPIQTAGPATDDANDRWDRQNVYDFEGTYGDYILNKVSQVFPQLRREIDD